MIQFHFCLSAVNVIKLNGQAGVLEIVGYYYTSLLLLIPNNLFKDVLLMLITSFCLSSKFRTLSKGPASLIDTIISSNSTWTLC